MSDGVQQVYEQPPQEQMQQQQSYVQQASPARSVGLAPAVIDTTDLRAFLMRCATERRWPHLGAASTARASRAAPRPRAEALCVLAGCRGKGEGLAGSHGRGAVW